MTEKKYTIVGKNHGDLYWNLKYCTDSPIAAAFYAIRLAKQFDVVDIRKSRRAADGMRYTSLHREEN